MTENEILKKKKLSKVMRGISGHGLIPVIFIKKIKQFFFPIIFYFKDMFAKH